MTVLKESRTVQLQDRTLKEQWTISDAAYIESEQKEIDRAYQACLDNLAPRITKVIADSEAKCSIRITHHLQRLSTSALVVVRAEIEPILKTYTPGQITAYVLYKNIGTVLGHNVFTNPHKITGDLDEAREWADRGDDYLYRSKRIDVPCETREFSTRFWSKPYAAGQKAAQHRLPINPSPYLTGSQAEIDWEAGWREATQDAKWKAEGENAFFAGESLESAPTDPPRRSRMWVYGYRYGTVDFIEHSAKNKVIDQEDTP